MTRYNREDLTIHVCCPTRERTAQQCGCYSYSSLLEPETRPALHHGVEYRGRIL